MGTSSSEVVSSDNGMSSTSSSEEDEDENEGEAERGMELVDEEEGEALKREMLRPSVWKMEAREGLLTVANRIIVIHLPSNWLSWNRGSYIL